MPKKYLRLVTHGVAKVDLNYISSTFEGLWVHTPAPGGVLIIAKNSTKLLCLLAVMLNHTDAIAQHLAAMESPYELQLVSKSAGDPSQEKALLTKFLKRLEQSLSQLQFPLYQSCYFHFFHSSITGITFTGKAIELEDKSRLQSTPFESARLAINSFNHFGAYKLSATYADYSLDTQFDGSLTPTPLPKLTAEGYFLWDILRDRNYKSLLFKNPHINQQIKDLILNPFQQFPIQRYLEWYNEFVVIIKRNSQKYTVLCTQDFQKDNFAQAATNAQQAVTNLLQLNEQQVEEELSIGYYNWGIALIKLGKFKESFTFLQKAKELCTKLGNIDRLTKINNKLADIKLLSISTSPTFFDLPEDVILNVISYFSLPDIARFSSVSARARTITYKPSLWKKKLLTDFTKEYLPETQLSYREQYKQKYKRFPKNVDKLDKSQQLNAAFKMNAEVWVKKLIRNGATLNYTTRVFENILKSRNKRLIKFLLKNGLDVNRPIDTDGFGRDQPISIFHMAVFEAPELLPLLLNTTDKITILPELHVAVLQNNRPLLQELLAKSADVDTEDSCECTALWWALLLNNYQIASLLLEKGAAIDKIKRSSITLEALHYDMLAYLIRQGNFHCLELLLENRLSSNTFAYQNGTYKTLLVIAAECGKTDMTRLLLKFGATVNPLPDENQLSQLHRSMGYFCESLELSAIAAAAKNNHTDCLSILAELSDVNALGVTYSSKDHKDHFIHRYPPLLEAISHLADQAVEMLLRRGATPNRIGIWSVRERNLTPDERPVTPLSTLLETFPSNLQNELTHPHYHPKSKTSRESQRWFMILELLLKNGANPNDSNVKINFIINLIKNPIRIMKLTDEFGRIIDCSSEELNKNNAQQFLLEALRILFLYKANFTQQDGGGKTLLHYAAKNGYFEVVRYLVEEIKIDTQVKDKQGETAIFLAARETQEDIFKYLKKVTNSAEESNLQGETPSQLISASFMKRMGR